MSGLPIPFVSNLKVFGFFLWLLLFFGGFLLPPVTGIMLNSVDDYKRTQANGLANLAYNLLGYLPAPAFYGFLSNIYGQKSRKPMGALLYSTIPTVILLCTCIYKKLEN